MDQKIVCRNSSEKVAQDIARGEEIGTAIQHMSTQDPPTGGNA